MKIGITERGDASIDYGWVEKLNDVDGAIVITKNVSDEFIANIIEHQDKLIVHSTCTGMGGTILEPNVPNWEKQLEQTQKLCRKGFPKEKVVIRIDPLFPSSISHFAHYRVFEKHISMVSEDSASRLWICTHTSDGDLKQPESLCHTVMTSHPILPSSRR